MSHTETDAPDDAAEESAQADVMIWVDLEMTGLDTRVHTIVEIAVIATDAVVLVEGEKCVDALTRVGIVATTAMWELDWDGPPLPRRVSAGNRPVLALPKCGRVLPQRTVPTVEA